MCPPGQTPLLPAEAGPGAAPQGRVGGCSRRRRGWGTRRSLLRVGDEELLPAELRRGPGGMLRFRC